MEEIYKGKDIHTKEIDIYMEGQTKKNIKRNINIEEYVHKRNLYM